MGWLRKWQRNEIFEAVRVAGLSPQEFDWHDTDNGDALRHRPSGAYFIFGGIAGDHASLYSAGDAPEESRSNRSHRALMQQVGLWLAEIKRDIDMPDLWAQLQSEAALLDAVSDDAIENTPFTFAEQEDISRQLRELRDYTSRTYSPLGVPRPALGRETRLSRSCREPRGSERLAAHGLRCDAQLCAGRGASGVRRKRHSQDASCEHRAHPVARALGLPGT